MPEAEFENVVGKMACQVLWNTPRSDRILNLFPSFQFFIKIKKPPCKTGNGTAAF